MESPETFQQDRQKTIEAALFLGELSIDDPNFNVSKLARLLYYADCEAYIHHGSPITGTTYVHFPHGPFPENWHQVREQMELAGDAEIVYEQSAPGCQSYRILPRRSADSEILSSTDKESLAAQVERFACFNPAGIEQYSHREIRWLSTEDGEPIAYALAGVITAAFSARDIRKQRANQ